MAAWQWQDRYTIGIDRIDHQHRYFLELINWLSALADRPGCAPLQRRHIEELMHYARFHFFSEENWMIDHGYPEWESHRELHDELIRRLNSRASQVDLGEADFPVLVHFLVDWFLRHTVEQDRKLGEFLRARPSRLFPDSGPSTE